MSGTHGISEPQDNSVGVLLVRGDKSIGPFDGVKACIIGGRAGLKTRWINSVHCGISFVAD